MEKVRFFELDGFSGVFAKVEDFVVGYNNILTYKIPMKIAHQIWKDPINDMPKDLEDLNKIEEIKDKFGVDFEDFEMSGVLYRLSDEYFPCYYYQCGMFQSELCNSEIDFFKSYSAEDIVLLDITNPNFEPCVVGNMSTCIELEFVNEGKCLEERWGVCLNWQEIYKDDSNNSIIAIVSNDNRSDSVNLYKFYMNLEDLK